MPRRPSSLTSRRLAVAAALALSAAACGGGDGSGAAADGAAATSTPGAAGDDGGQQGGGADAGGAGDDTPRGGSTEALSSSEALPIDLTDARPNAHGAPFAGRYFYDIEGTDSQVGLTVQDLLGDQDATTFDRSGDLGQLHTEYERAEARASLVRWSAAGMHLDAEQRAQNTSSGPNESPVCDYQPNLLLTAPSLRVGQRWSDTSSCESRQGDLTVTRDRTVSGEVLGASTVEVAGKALRTLRIKRVIDTTTRTDSTPPLLVTEHRELVLEWIVEAGLAGRAEGAVVETVSGSAKPARRFVWVLRSTTPEG
ncbi:MAG: hypothetical protein ACT452_16730 [Microthrixaceae bacterium]